MAHGIGEMYGQDAWRLPTTGTAIDAQTDKNADRLSDGGELVG